MNAVVSLGCVAGCALGMLLTAILLVREHRSHANVLLAGVIAVACLDQLLSAVEHLSQVSAGSALLRLTGFSGLLLAPLLFLYFRAQSLALRLRMADSWHFSCFVALQAIAMLEYLEPAASPGLGLRPYLQLACLLLITTYVVACIRVVCSATLPRRCSVFHNCRVAVTALIAALASYVLAAALLLPASGGRSDLADAVLSCALATLAWSAIRRAMSRDNDASAHHVISLPQAVEAPEKSKYGNNRLPDFARESIVAELKQHMESAQPWLKIDLTLGQLAEGVNVAPHHLSQIINSEFGKSFACYINEYRVSAACQLLSGEADRSVLDIALDSGFSSKSSFNASFKKHTGMTPSEYRKRFQAKNYLVA